MKDLSNQGLSPQKEVLEVRSPSTDRWNPADYVPCSSSLTHLSADLTGEGPDSGVVNAVTNEALSGVGCHRTILTRVVFHRWSHLQSITSSDSERWGLASSFDDSGILELSGQVGVLTLPSGRIA